MLPTGSMPSAARPSPDSTLAATTATVPRVTAAARADQRPTTPAPSSSRRPSSSSVRVCRRTTTNPSTAVRKAPIITVLNTARASAVLDATGPYSAMTDGLLSTPASPSEADSSVG